MSKATRLAIIDLPFASHFGINLNVGAVYNALRFAPTYCAAREIEGETYYFISRNMMCKKLALITDKPDTMYRYYKKLQQVGLVKLEKIGTQDYVHIIAEHAEKWNSDVYPTLGRSSEQLGCSSENTPQNSDVHPTYIRVLNKQEEVIKSKAKPFSSENFKPNPKPAKRNKADATTKEKVEKYITQKMGKLLLDDLVGTDYDVARLASEIANVAEDEGKFFNPKYPASKKWLEDKVWAWIARIEKTTDEEVPMSESTGEPFEVKASTYDRVISTYQKVTGRLTSESQRVYLAPIIREHITKPGITDDQLVVAFNQLRSAGEVFDHLDHTLKNISKLLTWAQQSAA